MAGVAVVLLNWRNADDTLACVESVLLSSGCDFQIIVCDNASGDDSEQRFVQWAQTSGAAASTSVLNAPYNTEARQADGTAPAVVWLQTGANLGFAGGCNVGIEYALRSPQCRFVWLLNNDCVVAPSAMQALVNKMQTQPDVGMCGSTLRYASPPHPLQAAGGAVYNRWTGRAHYVDHLLAQPVTSEAVVERQLSYVCGASMFVRREFIEQVGVMRPDYFLYFEEIDWASRSRAGLRLGYCRDSVVFHKEGATIGSSSNSRRASAMADYYLFRNRLRFTARFYPQCIPSVWAVMFLQALVRGLRGQTARMGLILRILFGLAGPSPPGRHRA